jgi:nucleoside-diphosphate-sugar epimerase
VDANPPHADAAGDAVGECAPLRQLGWKPRISLEAGISDMIAALVPQV